MDSDPLSLVIGENIRRFRRAREISQIELATTVGTTFQQLQKYEKGINRITATRLWTIADVLQVPITEFFSADARTKVPLHETAASLDDEMNTAWGGVSSNEQKLALITLMRTMV